MEITCRRRPFDATKSIKSVGLRLRQSGAGAGNRLKAPTGKPGSPGARLAEHLEKTLLAPQLRHHQHTGGAQAQIGVMAGKNLRHPNSGVIVRMTVKPRPGSISSS